MLHEYNIINIKTTMAPDRSYLLYSFTGFCRKCNNTIEVREALSKYDNGTVIEMVKTLTIRGLKRLEEETCLVLI